MIRLLALAALLLAPLGAAAQTDPPEYFRVTGVEAGDELNVRLAPDAGAEVLGGLPPGTGPVEVGARDASGRWGRIVFWEFTGWVSMHFLEPMEVAMLPDTTADGRMTGLPVGLTCSGTEPFWGFSLDEPGQVTFSNFEHDDLRLRVAMLAGARARQGLPAVVVAEGAANMTAMIQLAECSDGMSDSTFAMSTTVLLQDRNGTALYEGCCTLRMAQ